MPVEYKTIEEVAGPGLYMVQCGLIPYSPY
jgi:hypothetical protein